jgi:hypothetical protein
MFATGTCTSSRRLLADAGDVDGLAQRPAVGVLGVEDAADRLIVRLARVDHDRLADERRPGPSGAQSRT